MITLKFYNLLEQLTGLRKCCTHDYSLFSNLYLFIFRQRGREGEKEGEKHQCVVASQVPPTGDLASNPGMCPDWELNRRTFDLQAGAQSTESHQPGPITVSLYQKNTK